MEFDVEIFANGHQIDANKFKFIFGPNLKCNLYSKLDNFITYLINNHKELNSIDDQISTILNKINKVIDVDESHKESLIFIHDQLKLVYSKQKRYSSDLIVFASIFFYTFPVAYRFFRDSKLICLPHPNYIKTFNIGSVNSGSIQENYLSQKLKLLKPHEKYVNLLLDEIYVKPFAAYKGNKLEGFAQNAENHQLANTVQTFMVTSILSSNKDVVGLYPVKKLNSEYLFETTKKILDLLHNAGYETVTIISDNNQVNRKMFEKFSPSGQLQPYIISPYDSYISFI